MHKEKYTTLENKQKNLFTVALFCKHIASSCCAMLLLHTHSWTKKVYKWNKREKLKYTSNMRSQNEVIQVRCVELKLKVNNNKHKNNNNNNRRWERRSTGTKPQRKSWFILSSYWSPPKLLGRVSSHQWFPPFPPAIWICDRPGNAVTSSDVYWSRRFGHYTCGWVTQVQRCTSETSECRIFPPSTHQNKS